MKYIKQLYIIFIITFISEILEYIVPLPIAASVYGLVIILIALITKILPLEAVEDVAGFLVEIMPIMFILPIARVVTQWDLIKTIIIPIVVISLFSTIPIFGMTGYIAQIMLKRGKKKDD